MSTSINEKAQSAFELLIIAGAILAFFIFFLIILTGNLSDLNKRKESLLLKELALEVQTEINLASKSSDGYYREFRIPLNLQGKAYEINITDARIWIRTEQNALSLNTEEIQGDVKKGLNTIRKSGGNVYLNQ